MENSSTVEVAILGMVNPHIYLWHQMICRDKRADLVAISINTELVDAEYIKSILYKGNENAKNVKIYYDDEEMLNAHPEIELCFLGDSNKNTIKGFRLCAERGIHMFTMKVPTMSLDEYDEMIRLKREHNLIVHTELELRWQATTHRVKELVRTGKLGRIDSFIALNYSMCPSWHRWMVMPEQTYGDKIPLRKGSDLFRGGALTDHPHVFDLIRFIFESDVDTIYAQVGPKLREENPSEDFVYIIGKLKNGITFSIDPSYANKENNEKLGSASRKTLQPKCVQVELQINSSKGTLLSDCYFSDNLEVATTDSGYSIMSAFSFIPQGHTDILDMLCAKVRGRETHEYLDSLVDFEDHRKTIVSMLAAYESITTGDVVKVKY